jgi:DNA-binding Xre family transcriptional regulator
MGTKSRETDSLSDQAELDAILAALKKVMREKKMAYRELAPLVSLSESGLKKIFGSRDCSYIRLAQISRALGFKLTDLLAEIDRSEMRQVRFTEKQQAFLLKNMRIFRFFVKLVVERQTVESIQKEFSLGQKETFGVLKRLDELGLIQLLPKDQINLPPLIYVKDFGPGPLLEKVYKDWGESIVQELASPRFQSSGQFIIRTLRMRTDTYRELLGRLLDLESEFLRRAVREMSISTGTMKAVRWMWITDEQSFVKGSL